ncbi:uncharacterized protein BDR25DRAFT_394535 [Lindgomyces ingoldianus]|uniref:Uncharacterized protein n=1 Tax=Lindgomyces ingoldianus TaxID=673940 RepID=A0ACB6QQB2_9PLEO|nr:uncharacterized protein BDR25DRAFT_394535 [Lindgomyces ingoldianus]KAF2469204.1 hypothetical protein BDR25DRAFT_394535 [Lindgomyces ingoldianus]
MLDEGRPIRERSRMVFRCVLKQPGRQAIVEEMSISYSMSVRNLCLKGETTKRNPETLGDYSRIRVDAARRRRVAGPRVSMRTRGGEHGVSLVAAADVGLPRRTGSCASAVTAVSTCEKRGGYRSIIAYEAQILTRPTSILQDSGGMDAQPYVFVNGASRPATLETPFPNTKERVGLGSCNPDVLFTLTKTRARFHSPYFRCQSHGPSSYSTSSARSKQRSDGTAGERDDQDNTILPSYAEQVPHTFVVLEMALAIAKVTDASPPGKLKLDADPLARRDMGKDLSRVEIQSAHDVELVLSGSSGVAKERIFNAEMLQGLDDGGKRVTKFILTTADPPADSLCHNDKYLFREPVHVQRVVRKQSLSKEDNAKMISSHDFDIAHDTHNNDPPKANKNQEGRICTRKLERLGHADQESKDYHASVVPYESYRARNNISNDYNAGCYYHGVGSIAFYSNIFHFSLCEAVPVHTGEVKSGSFLSFRQALDRLERTQHNAHPCYTVPCQVLFSDNYGSIARFLISKILGVHIVAKRSRVETPRRSEIYWVLWYGLQVTFLRYSRVDLQDHSRLRFIAKGNGVSLRNGARNKIHVLVSISSTAAIASPFPEPFSSTVKMEEAKSSSNEKNPPVRQDFNSRSLLEMKVVKSYAVSLSYPLNCPSGGFRRGADMVKELCLGARTAGADYPFVRRSKTKVELSDLSIVGYSVDNDYNVVNPSTSPMSEFRHECLRIAHLRKDSSYSKSEEPIKEVSESASGKYPTCKYPIGGTEGGLIHIDQMSFKIGQNSSIHYGTRFSYMILDHTTLSLIVQQTNALFSEDHSLFGSTESLPKASHSSLSSRSFVDEFGWVD